MTKGEVWRTIRSMKKNVIAVFCLVLLTMIVLLTGCAKKNVSVYTLKENGIEYTLTLNETDGTFVLTEIKGGEKKEHEGTFTIKDGGVILGSTNFGYRSVRLFADTFAFITNPTGMEEKPEPCEHEWGKTTRTAGDCSNYGYSERVCKKCGEKERTYDTAYGDHVSDGGKHVEGKTCTDYGETVYTCTICKKTLETVMDASPSGRHDYLATDTVLDNGCQVVKTRLYKCQNKNCNHETYIPETSRAIGSHKDEDGDGICDVCKRMNSGLPSVHDDKDNDGYCDTCKVKMTVLQGVISFPCGYEENGRTYIGVYPQLIAGQSARDIKATGLYDEARDVWYYGKETYVLRTTPTMYEEKTFSDNVTASGKETYAFILQPLAFVKYGDKYICDRIVDGEVFLSESDRINNNGVTNVWGKSTLYSYVKETMAARIGCAEEIESVDLLTVEELPPANECVKTITDYALAGGVKYYDEDRKGEWFLRSPVADANDKVWSVGTGGIKTQAAVANIRGVVPVIRLKENNG